MTIGKNIKRLRTFHGLSQKELALIAGVSDKAVSTWENGSKDPRMGAIQRIADHFGLKKSSLIDDDGLDITLSPSPVLPTPAPLTSEEQSLIEKYRALDDADRALVDNIMDNLHDRRLSKLSDKSAETLSG